MTRRLLLGLLAVTLVVLVLLEVPIAIFYGQLERDRYISGLEGDGATLVSVYQDSFTTGVAPDPAPARRYAARTGARVVLVDDHGVSLVDTTEAVPRTFAGRPEIASALSGARAHGVRSSSTLGTDIVYVALPVRSAGSVHGALRLTIGAGALDRVVHRLWWALSGMAVVVLAVVAMASLAIARWINRPINRLESVARRFAVGDLKARADVSSGPPELVDLGSTMNDMASRLEALLREQRAFVADASHQLRTPLTGVRLRLENIQSRLEDGGVAELSDVEAALDEIARLARLVSDLLQLARADEPGAMVTVDVLALARERVDTWSAMADLEQVVLVVESSLAHADARAVQGAVEQILDNTIDNAIAISSPGDVVQVSVTADGKYVELSVIDHGPGLTPDEQRQVFQRFWRGSSATPGTGLGLPIARSLAVASGGDLRVSDTPGGGLTVQLRLDVAD